MTRIDSPVLVLAKTFAIGLAVPFAALLWFAHVTFLVLVWGARQ
jgi:hypothetical protein